MEPVVQVRVVARDEHGKPSLYHYRVVTRPEDLIHARPLCRCTPVLTPAVNPCEQETRDCKRGID